MRRISGPLLSLALVAAPLSMPLASAQSVEVRPYGDGSREAGFAFEGIHLDVGVVDPQSADRGLVLGIGSSLGTRLHHWLDFGVGARWWSADLESAREGVRSRGSVQDFAVHTNLSLRPIRIRGTQPYVLAGIAAHFVGADIPDDAMFENALAGFGLGVDAAIGIETTRPGIGVRLEARRSYVDNVGNWAFTIGVGWWPSESATAGPRLKRVSRPVATSQGWMIAPPTTASSEPASQDTTTAGLLRAVSDVRSENASLRAELDSLRAAPSLVESESTRAREGTSSVDDERGANEQPSNDDPFAQVRDSMERLAALSQGTLQLIEDADGIRVRFSAASTFDSGSTRLQTRAVEQLRRFSVVMFRFPELTAVVEGHTDATGTDARNLAVSQQRAESVMDELVAIGVEPSRLRAIGQGSTRPVAVNTTTAGRELNRRVEILVLAATPPLRR